MPRENKSLKPLNGYLTLSWLIHWRWIKLFSISRSSVPVQPWHAIAMLDFIPIIQILKDDLRVGRWPYEMRKLVDVMPWPQGFIKSPFLFLTQTRPIYSTLVTLAVRFLRYTNSHWLKVPKLSFESQNTQSSV
jgi:uncharacterized membrane protein